MLIIWSLLVPFVFGQLSVTKLDNVELTIENGTLKSVKQSVKSEELNLSNLGIRDIDDDAFDNLEIKSLNLQNNDIKVIDGGVFSKLKGLEVLNLASNQISHVYYGFLGLDHLKQLDLSNNPLDYLGSSDLLGIPKNADIFVRGNKLWSLSTRVFEEPLPKERDEGSESEEENSEEEPSRVDAKKRQLKEEAVPLIEKYDESLKLGVFLKHAKPAALDTVFNIIVCIEDGILTSISLLEEGEEAAGSCRKIIIDGGVRTLNLQNLGIRNLLKGWYQLKDHPIVSIDLGKNQIAEISQDFFNDLPEEILRVDISSNLIRQIKKDTIKNEYIKLFNLGSNVIEDIEDGSFENTKLWSLYLAGNKIADISFASSLPDTLTELYLNDNQILYIPDGNFLKQAHLAVLSLSQNGITGIQKNAFQGLNELLDLSLTGNKISKIEPGGLASLKKLTRLFLSQNLISGYEKGTFENLENLKNLHLAKNAFKEIKKDTFGDLPKGLDILDLDDNDITSLEEGSFVGIPKHTLKLSNNKISNILPTCFDVHGLVNLNLKNNLIGRIKEDSFNGLPGLRYLWLSGNHIADLPRGSLKSLPDLIIFDISVNPMKELKNGALFGLPKNKRSNVFIADNQLELIQGGAFDDL